MRVAVVSWTTVAPRARSTVRHAEELGADVAVLDLDGSYRPVGAERVLRGTDVGVPDAELRRAALRRGAAPLARSLQPALVGALAVDDGRDEVVLVLAAGVLLLSSPDELERCAAECGLALVARDRGPEPPDGRHPDTTDLAELGAHDPALIAIRAATVGGDALAHWAAAEGQHARWLDVVAAVAVHETVRDAAVLVGGWTLRSTHHLTADGGLALDGRPVVAVDLSELDADSPWVLRPGVRAPRALLSEHPALAALVAAEVASWAADGDGTGEWDPDRTGLGLPLDDTLRRAASLGGSDGPDLLDPAQADAAREWLVSAGSESGLGPFLRGLHARPDLRSAFPRVPGADEPAFLAWARVHALDDGSPAELLGPALDAADRAHRDRAPALRTTDRPAPGVNVVGFLGAELGIGESARLLISALKAHGIPFSTRSVDRFAQSRLSGARSGDIGTEVFDTTIVCVNSDLTPTVAPAVADLMDRSYRIGMWYWEVEDFPATQHGGFAVLDEVWVATDFVRRAVEPHSPVPVRTVTPPLPQRRGEPQWTREALGLPDRPYLLFSFDFLSTAERKNPLGLVDAFTAAFAPDAGPLLVIKSINADLRPAQAERLRLVAAGRPDILLMEHHLEASARDALVAHCTAYVSLHRAEGLGLTMAEAMAWGRPVIATAYSGNLQFMTDENSFLVPWTPGHVPAGAEPYPAGGRWAEPALDAAAALMRLVVEQPELAAARGARAAADIATLHTAEAAGNMVAERLAELAGRRRSRSRIRVGSLAAAAARVARRRLAAERAGHHGAGPQPG